MEIEKALLEEAQYAVSNLKNRARALEPQLQEIERLKLEIEAECHAARLAPKRLLEYRLKIERSTNAPIAGSTPNADLRFARPTPRATTVASCVAKLVPLSLPSPRRES